MKIKHTKLHFITYIHTMAYIHIMHTQMHRTYIDNNLQTADNIPNYHLNWSRTQNARRQIPFTTEEENHKEVSI
jgi:hypothetical protein